MPRGSCRSLAWVVLCTALCGPCATKAQADDAASEADLKAAYMLNFLRYTHWPDDAAAPGPPPPLEVVVVGPQRLASSLRSLAREAEADGLRAVRVRRMENRDLSDASLARSLRRVDALFVDARTWPEARRLLQHVRDRPVLTVGDNSGFAAGGGMLGLVPQGRRITFDANPAAIQSSGLQVSAKVLKLARIVGDEGGAR